MSKNLPLIDVHHHFFPLSLNKATKNISVGWRTPEGNLPWTPEISLNCMDEMNIQTAILSLPPNSIGSVGADNRRMMREYNLYAHKVCGYYPGRFGFFAGVGFLDDTEGALEEIAFALDTLGADGVALTSSYGEGNSAVYIGDDRYDSIWEELDKRKAVVFLHGAQTASSTPYPHAFLGIPISEVPNETFKAVAHLVVTGKKRKYSSIKFILAHLGGSTPFLAARVAVLSRHMGCPLSPEEILEDFKDFYYETALSGYSVNLTAVEEFVGNGRILFGSDFPAVSADMAKWYTKNIEEYYADDPAKLTAVTGGNAFSLFPRLQNVHDISRL